MGEFMNLFESEDEKFDQIFMNYIKNQSKEKKSLTKHLLNLCQN